MEWVNTLALWIGPMAWLSVGGWAFRHHVEQPTTKKDDAAALFIFSVVLAPFSAGIAVWEITQATKKAKAK